MAATPFLGHANGTGLWGELSTSKAIYDNPANVCPADRLYASAPAGDYNPLDPAWANQPGAAARANGFPRAV